MIDALREVKPPFSPESVVAEFATLLKTYDITKIAGDRYAGEWPREQFRHHCISYEPASKPKSDLYRDALPLINSRRIELPDHPRLITQLAGLERRTARGGRAASTTHPTLTTTWPTPWPGLPACSRSRAAIRMTCRGSAVPARAACKGRSNSQCCGATATGGNDEETRRR